MGITTMAIGNKSEWVTNWNRKILTKNLKTHVNDIFLEYGGQVTGKKNKISKNHLR